MTFITPIDEIYKIKQERILGKGSYGVVVTGIHKESNVEYAIKLVNTESGKRHRIEREYKLLKDIDHPNIVRLFAVYDTPHEVGFVMELCTGGHIGHWLERIQFNPRAVLPETTTKSVIRQLLSAIAHMHDRGICHRDIKLQNIMREHAGWNAQIKLIDFGLGTRFIGATPMKTRCGTLYATAPEVLRESYDERCDVWSAGVVAFTMLSGRKPFEALVLHPASGEDSDGKCSVMANILMGRYHYRHKDWKKVSSTAMEFTQKMLTHDYKQRWSAQEALEHDWFSERDDGGCSGDADDVDSTDDPVDPVARARKFSSTSIMSDSSGDANMVQTAFKNLKRHSDVSVLHQTSMLAVAYNMPQNKTADRRAFFQSFDVDKNGTLDREEFRAAMLACNIFNTGDTEKLSEDDIDCIFKAVDANGDNQISFTEFLAATLDPRDFDIQALNTAFQILDTDQKGYITFNDMERVLSVTSAARKRSVIMSQTSSQSLLGKGVGISPSLSKSQSIKSAPSKSSKVCPVVSNPTNDNDSDDNSADGAPEEKDHSFGRGRSMSLGNVLRRPSMLKDIMPMMSAPRRSSMTSAPIALSFGASGESEHSNSDIKIRKKSSSVIPILSAKSSPMLYSKAQNNPAPPPELDPVVAEQIQRAIKLVDKNGTGVVSYTDFLLALTENGNCSPSKTRDNSPRTRTSSCDQVTMTDTTASSKDNVFSKTSQNFRKLSNCEEKDSMSGSDVKM
eukprot:CAMPEP_0185023354 /NCGR_PEP_ID=MMETSP1103-20130426/6035_1 /TAXON_ID=36769 /ORGANISM="Paraphysomonas bandaiensis, Strain Caron Lab Isolate" /LENGTH=732 /DNA_ID=CAMNT_0027555911 /DNA_START=177 /DNA_END=2375 /DNA_ORIENTATION=+